MHALIRLAQHTGEETRSNGRVIGLQCALTALRYSANARDVHFLRAMPRRLVQEAAGLHDRGIMVTTATVMEPPVPCCDTPERHVMMIQATPTPTLASGDKAYTLFNALLTREEYVIPELSAKQTRSEERRKPKAQPGEIPAGMKQKPSLR